MLKGFFSMHAGLNRYVTMCVDRERPRHSKDRQHALQLSEEAAREAKLLIIVAAGALCAVPAPAAQFKTQTHLGTRFPGFV